MKGNAMPHEIALRNRRIIIAILLCFAVLLSINLLNPPPESPVMKAKREFETDIEKFIHIPNLINHVGKPYIYDRVIVINRSSRSVDIYMNSNIKHTLANNPNEVGTIIWLDYREEKVGHYTGGNSAFQKVCDVSIIDFKNKQLIHKATFAGDSPPDRRGWHPLIQDWHGHEPSGREIIEYINKVPSKQEP